ncbi:MAG: DNA-directed DNA polymerase II small subunit [Nitrosopumilus sp.]|uniref:DNA-directed DNA polymerase II small subunit n=1 Tax=Nitrosopumilus sp. TaxID=2024843 RepID=UPI00246A112E|nr:DNA-directed DNA polymerase II small subunit [Nitrosopumilus sp.]MDH5430558.1 DNA-directed DNA polymerase II small subunit [Nitrosopumilus sp.]MDH5697352.1 DNA-directed DNA polymerase II small subunit [Nitrosopumilus sp.]
MKKELTFALNYALNKGFQIHPDAFKILEDIDVKKLEKIIKEIVREKTRQKLFQINQDDLETYLGIKDDLSLQNEIKILSDPTSKITSGEGVKGYNALFSSRFNKLKRIISDRPESKMLKSAASLKNTKIEDDLYVCGLVSVRSSERNITKIVLEDPSGSFEGIIFDEELQKTAGTLLLDQFVMARVGSAKNSGYIIKDLILPDIPEQAKNKSESEAYAVFLSDLHIGSRYFMEEEFSDFVSWISSPDPIAKKIRFVLIGGDVVDGVGIYPNQNKELVCQTIQEQLKKAEDLIDKIPKNVKIIIMPGNHDPGRRALPQPAIPQKYNSGLWERENVFMVGNPAVVSLNGVKVSMFHGQSIDDIVKTTPGLSYDRPTDVMRHLLRARHLSPIYGNQTPIAPEMEDLMVIQDIPDIFHVGHVHRAQLDMYKGILLINSGSWQKQTPFQASVGMTPNPGIAILVNLKTFQVFHQNYSSNLDNILQS